MKQEREIPEFIKGLEAIISNGKEEAKARKGSLERMRLAANRQGRKDDAENIAIFLGAVAKEIDFFRKAAGITAENHAPSISARIKTRFFTRPLTPSTFQKMEETLSAEQPFACVEGFFAPVEKSGGEVGPSNLRGPFFAAVAHNSSENTIDLMKGTLVCLFSQAHKNDKAVELRIWSMGVFAAALGGKKFDQSSLSVPPDSNGVIVAVHKGPLSELFQIAVEAMVKASLSRDPPANIAEEWMNNVKGYFGLQVEEQPIAALSAPAAQADLHLVTTSTAEVTAIPR